MEDQERMLTVREVAALFGVAPKTIRRWTAAGKLPCRRTPSGRARYPESEIRAMAGAPDASPGLLPESPPGPGEVKS